MFFRLVSIFSLLLFAAATAQAQSSENFYEDILVDEEIQVEDKAGDAVRDARRLLQEKPKPITIERPEFKRRKKPQPVKKAEKTAAPEDLSAAPFGLLWGATVADIKNLGITLTPIEIKDYLNSYAATTLPKPIKTFREVDVTFGADNELWRIIAYGELLDDTPDAAFSRPVIADKRGDVDGNNPRRTLPERIIIHQIVFACPALFAHNLVLKQRQHRITAAEGKQADFKKSPK